MLVNLEDETRKSTRTGVKGIEKLWITGTNENLDYLILSDRNAVVSIMTEGYPKALPIPDVLSFHHDQAGLIGKGIVAILEAVATKFVKTNLQQHPPVHLCQMLKRARSHR